jgi:hypothetical protein
MLGPPTLWDTQGLGCRGRGVRPAQRFSEGRHLPFERITDNCVLESPDLTDSLDQDGVARIDDRNEGLATRESIGKVTADKLRVWQRLATNWAVAASSQRHAGGHLVPGCRVRRWSTIANRVSEWPENPSRLTASDGRMVPLRGMSSSHDHAEGELESRWGISAGSSVATRRPTARLGCVGRHWIRRITSEEDAPIWKDLRLVG